MNCGDQLKISCELRDGCLRLTLDEIVALGYFLNTCHISPQPPGTAADRVCQASTADTGQMSHRCSQAVVNSQTSRESREKEQGKEQKLFLEETEESFVASDGDQPDLPQSLVSQKRTGCVREAIANDGELCYHSRQGEEQKSAIIQENGCIMTHSRLPVVACSKESPVPSQEQGESKNHNSQVVAEVESLENGRRVKDGTKSYHLNHASVANWGNVGKHQAVSDTKFVALGSDRHRDMCPSSMELEEDGGSCLTSEKDTTDSAAADCAHSPGHPINGISSSALTCQATPRPHQHNRDDPHPGTFHLHREEVRQLNNRKFNSLCLSALQHARIFVKSARRIMSISSGFPVQGLLGLKSGFEVADICYVGHSDRQEMESLIDSVWQSNSLSGSWWNWWEGTVEEVVDGYEGGVPLDLVYMDMVEMTGSLRAGLLDELKALR